MRHCIICGEVIRDNVSVCPNCGSPVDRSDVSVEEDKDKDENEADSPKKEINDLQNTESKLVKRLTVTRLIVYAVAIFIAGALAGAVIFAVTLKSRMQSETAIDWKDEALEAKMRGVTGISSGDIMYSDVKDITSLHFGNISGANPAVKIKDISALSSLTNLTYLELYGNQISDISALSSLTNLTHLYLGYNQIEDIGALSSLTNLKELDLDDNQISDISALSSLTNLKVLDLDDNQINDISALSSLTNLISLSLRCNQISDISALSSLTNLDILFIINNPIKDYSPIESLEIKYLYK